MPASISAFEGRTRVGVWSHDSGTFTKVDAETLRWGHTATPFGDGHALIVGGIDPVSHSISSVDAYDPRAPGVTLPGRSPMR